MNHAVESGIHDIMLTPSSCLDAAFALRVPSAAAIVADAKAICRHETFIFISTSVGDYQLINMTKSVLCGWTGAALWWVGGGKICERVVGFIDPRAVLCCRRARDVVN